MNQLNELLKINTFGKKIFQGNNYQVKYRIGYDLKKWMQIQQLKNRYPELLIHKTTNNSLIFGGTFSKAGNFEHEVKLIMGRP